jgi:hypothetical protein
MLPFETTEIPEEDEDDIDPFAELEIGTKAPLQNNSTEMGSIKENDLLSAFDDDEDDIVEEVVLAFDDEDAPALEKAPASANNSAESTYKLLLETVWVDDILDPSEVELLARKRGELGLTFERHLQLVRDIIGG